MKYKSLIALVLTALAPTFLLAQANMKSAESTGMPSGMPPAPIPTNQSSPTANMGKEDQRKPIFTNSSNPQSPSQASIIKKEESSDKSGTVGMKK